MMAAESPELRCADVDRDRVAAQLREHYAEGRLNLDEFQERTNAVYAAKTFGDLQPLTADLPAPVPAEQQEEEQDADEEESGGRGRLLAMWSPWLSASVICVGIWLISMLATSQWIYPWPVWVAGPWGVILLAATVGGAGSQRRHLERRDERLRRQRLRREWQPHGLDPRSPPISQDREYLEHREHWDHRR